MTFASAGIVRGLRGALGTPDLRRLQLASIASCVGGWAFMVALSVYAYDAGGATAVGLAALARMLPAGVAAPFAGLVADRSSRRDVLVASAAGRGAVAAAIAVAVGAGAPLAVVLALAALLTVLQTVQRPGQAALLAHLARTPVQLAAANATWSGLESASFLVGALLGGGLIAATGTTAVFAVTAAVFAVATAALAAIARDPVPAHRAALTSPRELAAGLRAVRRERALALVVGTVAVTTFVEGIVDVLVVVGALTILHLGEAGAGWLNAAWGLGGLAGGGAGLALLHRGRLAGGLAGGAALAGVALLALAALPSAAAALALLVLFGIGYALVDTAELTFVQRLASDELLARAFGVTETLYWITTGLGAAVAPLLIAWLGVRGALAAAGAALVGLVVVRARPLARLEDVRPLPARPFALLRGVGFLATVPLGALENLALCVAPVAAVSGEDVVRQGEAADRFYVVDSGTLAVHADGRPVARLGAGDCFGEIALLRDGVRTATVTATDAVSLYALEREDFLAVVAGLPRVAEQAHGLAAVRLAEVAACVTRRAPR
jgi:MFS family permease